MPSCWALRLWRTPMICPQVLPAAHLSKGACCWGAGMCLELIAPNFPSLFLMMACLGSVARAVTGDTKLPACALPGSHTRIACPEGPWLHQLSSSSLRLSAVQHLSHCVLSLPASHSVLSLVAFNSIADVLQSCLTALTADSSFPQSVLSQGVVWGHRGCCWSCPRSPDAALCHPAECS